MKIIHCPKGGRVPEGYCRMSCLNYKEARGSQTVRDRGKKPYSISPREKTPRRAANGK